MQLKLSILDKGSIMKTEKQELQANIGAIKSVVSSRGYALECEKRAIETYQRKLERLSRASKENQS